MKSCLTSLLTLMVCVAHGQIDRSNELFIGLMKQDSIFFERSFNRCDIEYLERSISPDLKFYHDQSGVQDREAFLENSRKYICAKGLLKPIRKPEADSFAVFPLYEDGLLYGAIQNGIHHFYLREEGTQDRLTGSARFTHVWIIDNNRWILETVISYDHQSRGDR